MPAFDRIDQALVTRHIIKFFDTDENRVQSYSGGQQQSNIGSLLAISIMNQWIKSAMDYIDLFFRKLFVYWSWQVERAVIPDKCTLGGILTRGITEFCGSASSGKTQLLLHLCLTVQLNDELGGLSGGAAFVCTENRFPSKRLFEMSKYFIRKFPAFEINYMDNVYVEHLYGSKQLSQNGDVTLFLTMSFGVTLPL
uniref:RecA family profile 1 domain-containing protein n=1 Tax=Glossina pallidipes TaxID=7398 RepID=A0A1A9ZRU3_GLOPL